MSKSKIRKTRISKTKIQKIKEEIKNDNICKILMNNGIDILYLDNEGDGYINLFPVIYEK
jgi:hypothetical protein